MIATIEPETTGSMALLESALEKRAAGVSVIPVRADKTPASELMPNGTWLSYQDRIATEQEIKRWFDPANMEKYGVAGLAVVPGPVSGNLICYDFDRDTHEEYEDWRLMCGATLDGAIEEKSGKGHHAWVRLTEGTATNRSEKLAHFVPPIIGADGRKHDTIAETKGAGGYVIIPPSLHGETGKYYRHVSGDWFNIPVLSQDDHDFCRLMAAGFDQKERTVDTPKNVPPVAPKLPGGAISFDVVNEAGATINGFLKRCDSANWEDSLVSWCKAAVWAKTLNDIVGDGRIWQEFEDASKRHPAYRGRHDDRKLDKMYKDAPMVPVAWSTLPFIYKLHKDKVRYFVDLPKGWVEDEQLRAWLPPGFDRRQLLKLLNSEAGGQTSGQAVNDYSAMRHDTTDTTDTTDGEVAELPVLRIVNANGIKNAPDAEYIFEDIVPIVKGGFALIFAPKGSLKSFFALHCAFNLVLKGKKVLYMAGEGHDGYKNRLKAIEIQYGTEYDPDNLLMTEVAYKVTDREYMPLLKKYVAEQKPDLIIVDTLARHKDATLKENDNDDMSEFVDLCNSLRVKAGKQCTIMVFHHTPGGDDAKARGATSVINAADTAILLNRNDDTLSAKLAFQKDGLDNIVMSFEFKIIQLDEKTTSGVLIPTETKIRSLPKKIGQRELEVLVFIGNYYNEDHGARFSEIKGYFNGKYSERQLYDAVSKIKAEKLIESRVNNKKDPYIPSARGYELIKTITPDDRTNEEKSMGDQFRPR